MREERVVVTVRKFGRVVIPKATRELMNLQIGDKLVMKIEKVNGKNE